MRVGRTAGSLLLFGLALHLHLHHKFHGPPIDYAGLGLASFASFVGIPGPGEPLLIAAGIFAAKHQLDIATVLGTAWLGATLGGIAGWLGGMKFGRRFLAAPGPLRGMRRSALARGDEIFERFTVLAIVLTPSWVAGIHGVQTRLYLLVNVLSAFVWAFGIGLGAYFAGPAIVEFVGDLGTVTAVGLGLLVATAVAIELRRRTRSRRRRYRGATATDPATTSGGTAPPGPQH